ncbi:MAG: hypothetical protein KDK36_02215 [Leptospiraceae bacterium]|nr:hypothetical protein [Leptospiraceae bacterium]
MAKVITNYDELDSILLKKAFRKFLFKMDCPLCNFTTFLFFEVQREDSNIELLGECVICDCSVDAKIENVPSGLSENAVLELKKNLIEAVIGSIPTDPGGNIAYIEALKNLSFEFFKIKRDCLDCDEVRH